jgi:hypothetical protein
VKSVNSIKSSDKQQYDSIIQYPSKEKLGRFEVDNAGIYCVFDKKQIKSIKTLNETITEEIQETINVDGKNRPTRNSNGKLIHPTIEGIENFWKWFGDSEIVDNKGRPLVMYHGTSNDFSTFKASQGNYGKGVYTTSSEDLAGMYTRHLDDAEEGRVEFYNPLCLYTASFTH